MEAITVMAGCSLTPPELSIWPALQPSDVSDVSEPCLRPNISPLMHFVTTVTTSAFAHTSHYTCSTTSASPSSTRSDTSMELKRQATTEARTPPQEQEQNHGQERLLCSSAATAAAVVFVLVTVIFAQAAYRVRHRPGDLAFVLSMYAMLALLLCCLRRFERLPAEAPAEARERLKRAVWLLSAGLSLGFAWRVAEMMPLALKALVWAMTSAVVLAGFYGLFICKADECCKQSQSGSGKGMELSPEEKV